MLLGTARWPSLLQQKLSPDAVSCREAVRIGDGGGQRGLNLQSSLVRYFSSTPTSLPSFPASPGREGATSTSGQQCWEQKFPFEIKAETTCLQAESMFESRDQEISMHCCSIVEIPGYIFKEILRVNLF